MAPKYEFLKPVFLAKRCFLAEVLYWRAFGRVPDEEDDNPKTDYRFSLDAMEDHIAPIPFGLELSEAECKYAGIPPDPEMTALIAEEYHSTPQSIIERRESWRKLDDFEFSEDELEAELQAAILHQEKLDAWRPQYEAYLDQFRMQICLDLRRGKLIAHGYRLPANTFEESSEIFFAEDRWPSATDREPIPSSAWLSQDVHWKDSALYGSSGSFIWIFVEVDEMMELYPPDSLVKDDKAFRVGAMVAVASDALSFTSKDAASRRGRPPLPWSLFHVEVARLYRDGEMPRKKEAAIAIMQDWFVNTQSRPVSRSAIGEKLKPYFDGLLR